MKRNLCLVLLTCAASASFALPLPTRTALKGSSLKQRLLKRASFAEDWSRYPSPDAILKDLHARFPRTDLSTVTRECRQLTKDTRAVLGDSDPATGAPAMDRPNAAFVNWYVGCLAQYIRYEKVVLPDVASLDQAAEIYSMSLLRACPTVQYTGGIDLKAQTFEQSRFYCRWGFLSPADRQAVVREFAIRYVGPAEVWTDLGLAASAEDFVDQILNEIDDYEAKTDQRYAVVDVVSHPISAFDAVRIIQLLINLQNTLKY